MIGLRQRVLISINASIYPELASYCIHVTPSSGRISVLCSSYLLLAVTLLLCAIVMAGMIF